VPEERFSWQYNDDSNSIALVIKHMNGNMFSRWTDFLTTDGEKSSRERDKEFINEAEDKNQLMLEWEKAWACLFSAMDALTPPDLEAIIYIRNQGHTVVEAINRQLAHYPYHVGQIVFIAKMICGAEWKSLSIPKNASTVFNEKHFSKTMEKKHFSNDALGNDKPKI
jgi:hypothetical protein